MTQRIYQHEIIDSSARGFKKDMKEWGDQGYRIVHMSRRPDNPHIFVIALERGLDVVQPAE